MHYTPQELILAYYLASFSFIYKIEEANYQDKWLSMHTKWMTALDMVLRKPSAFMAVEQDNWEIQHYPSQTQRMIKYFNYTSTY